jgi:membrane-bound lytic murein transglycosylase D
MRPTTLLGGILLALAAVAAPLSCAPKRPAQQPSTPAPPPAEPPSAAPGTAAEPTPDLRKLYDALERDRAQYRDGLESIAAGDEVPGEELIAAAAHGLAMGAQECDRTPGCDMQRFLQVFDALMTEQNIALKRVAARVDELEAGIQAEQDETEREPGTSPFVAAMPEVGKTVALLRGTDLRDIISLNGPVKAALDDWLTWMRPNLMDAYENYQYLRQDIAPIYEKAGLPEALLFAMIATESGGKVHAFSRAGAAGILQFMRRTGHIYGLGVDDGFDTRLDPVAATRASVAFLNDRFAELNNSLEKALAAYNGGEGRLHSLERRLKGASLWDKRVYYSLPRETREYVPRVLAAAWLFLHPGDYGLEWPAVDTGRATLTVRNETSLGELTVCLGQEGNPNGWFRTLRNLNPRLDPGDRIEAGTQITVPAVVVPIYEQRCLDGDVVARARELHDANYPPGSEFIPYIVRRGDTLGRIAARHRCVSLSELAALNNIRPPRYVIHIGQELKIPDCD